MSKLESSVVFFPRFSTLMGTGEFSTVPLDVSEFGGAQIQAWFGAIEGGTPTRTLYIEESLDGVQWPAAASTSYEAVSGFYSMGFRLRWLRLRIVVEGSGDERFSCWIEGILRAGGGGAQEWIVTPAAGESSSFDASPSHGDIAGSPGRTVDVSALEEAIRSVQNPTPRIGKLTGK